MVLVSCVLFFAGSAHAQSPRWETEMHKGQMAIEQKQFARAEKRFKTALKEAERTGQSHRHWAEALDQLAEVYIAQRKYAEAESLYERAVNARGKKPDSSYAGLAQNFDNLGDLYSADKKPNEADRLYARAKEIREKLLAVHPEIYVDGQPKTVKPTP